MPLRRLILMMADERKQEKKKFEIKLKFHHAN